MSARDRTYFQSVDEALTDWGRFSPDRVRRVKSVVEFFSREIGQVHSIYVGQRGDAIGMSFGDIESVCVYVHGNRLDVAPLAVERLGGIAAMARSYPGFTQAPGQRHRYARLRLN